MTEGRTPLRRRLAWPLGLGFLWLLFLLVLAIWSVRSERIHVVSMAEREAKAFFQQIVVTRAWNAAHGGVYVLATPSDQPNEYLPESERSLKTEDGRVLSLINPAYMTRQISTIASDDHEVKFHITSLDPIRPGNKADEWEARALQSFNRGAGEEFDLVDTRNGRYFRYMAPLYAKESCMRCHAQYGHSGKTILGGISITFLADPLIETRKSSVAQTHLAFTLIFLVGFVGICGSTYLVQQKREEAERANRTKTMFLANMSHDMRTPLNGIMGMTELLRKKGLGKEQKRYADMVSHSARTLLEIITDITDFSRLESGRLELSETVFNVRDTLEDTLAVFRFESGNKGLELAAEVDPDVPVLLKGDAFRLKQVVANLVGNGVKFTQQGGVTVRVSREEPIHIDGNRVRLRVVVEDTGIGIPQGEQSDIFDSFRQVDDSYAKKHEGSGLGLAICKQLVTMMGGSIAVESRPGAGSAFIFDVLLTKPTAQEAERAAVAKDVESSPVSEPQRVLVAEDNVLNQTFAMDILTEAGHRVAIAENGQQAIDALRDGEFDIVFMDVQMPEMDGLEATRRIRAGAAGDLVRDIPIVAATAFAVRGDREKCLEAGMNGYVVKPLQSRDLIQAVAKYTATDSRTEVPDMTPKPTEQTSVIDVDGALERLGGRRSLFDKLAATFLADTPPKMTELAARMGDGNMDEVLRLAHGIKNSAGMIQATDMSAAALALEMAVREDRLTEVPELFDALKEASDLALADLARLTEAS